MVARPMALTMPVRLAPPAAGRIDPTKMLFPTAAKAAPTPSPNRGSTWVGLTKKTMHAMAIEAKRAWNILIYNAVLGGETSMPKMNRE
jgi:hypothetical protein